MAVFRKSKDKTTRGGRKAVSFDSADEAVLDRQIDHWVGGERPRLGEVLLDLGVVEHKNVTDALAAQQGEATQFRAEATHAAQSADRLPPPSPPSGDAGHHSVPRPSSPVADWPGKPGDGPVPPTPPRRIGEILVSMGCIDEIALAAALSRQFGVPLADLRLEKPEPEAVNLIPEALAREHGMLPLRLDGDRLQVVSADPYDVGAIRAITHQVGKVALRIGARSEIDRHLDRAYDVLRSADAHIRAFELTYDELPESTESSIAVDENAPIVQVANRVITQAVRQRASDVHIEPTEDSVRVRYRIDGALTTAIELPVRMGSALVSRIKVMAELNIVERRRPQDGQFSVQVDGRPIDLRCSIVPTTHGEKTVLRLLDKTRSLISLNELGMSDRVAEQYREIVSAPLGMMLCTGPTGSGKTTTLYATLNEVNDPTKNVVTIEDPVEYQFEGITQMPVSGTGITFADGLRSILRQDPDTILVGEIRDEETARIAMQAALTGHFVLSSLHAIDAVAAIHRFTDMGIEPFLVASAISAVVGQRLLRRNCTACADTYTPTASEARTLAEFTPLAPIWTKGRGCQLCSGTGYRGRVGVYELLVFDDKIRNMVVARSTHHEIRAAAMEQGMHTMQQQAFDLVAKGITTVEDVLRSVYAPGMDRAVPPVGELPAGKPELDSLHLSCHFGQDGDSPADNAREGSGSDVIELGPPRVGSAVGEGER